MANTKSALKAMRQNIRHRERNRSNTSRLRTHIRKLLAAVEAGDAEAAEKLLPETISIIDRSIQKGVIHRNAAARYKSRLTLSVNRLLASR